MNIKQKQEEEELFYLKHFLRRMEIVAESVRRGEDPPDFYVVYESDRIAIELTEYHSMRKGNAGHAWRSVEEEWRHIRDIFIKERELYPELNDVYGVLFFRGLEMPPSKKHRKFIMELLEFGIIQHRSLTEEISWFNSFSTKFPLLNKYLKKIYLQKVNCYITWDRSSAAFIGISEEELEECISNKLNKTRPQQINENWLLIVSGTAMSQQIGLIPCEKFNGFVEINSCLKTSPFDKVFFFQYVWQRVLCWSTNKHWEEVKPAITIRGPVSGLH